MGKTGHCSLATFACDQLTTPNLSTLMLVNRDRISFAIAELSPAGIDQATKDAKKNGTFVPLCGASLAAPRCVSSIPGTPVGVQHYILQPRRRRVRAWSPFVGGW